MLNKYLAFAALKDDIKSCFLPNIPGAGGEFNDPRYNKKKKSMR